MDHPAHSNTPAGSAASNGRPADGHAAPSPPSDLRAPDLDAGARRSLPPPVLSGRTDIFPPGALLSLLNLQKVTGVLYLHNRSLTAMIGMEEGEVTGAALGAEQGVPALFYALSWNTGRFEFRFVPPGPHTINLTLPVIQVRATLWLDRWKELRRVFPTIWHRVAIHPQPSGEVVIQPHQWQLLTRIVAEPASLVKLAEYLRIDVLAVTRVAAELVNLGLAVVIPPDENESAQDAAEDWS